MLFVRFLFMDSNILYKLCFFPMSIFHWLKYNNENSAKKNLNFTRIVKTNMNVGAGQKNTKLSLTLELINNVFADLPI